MSVYQSHFCNLFNFALTDVLIEMYRLVAAISNRVETVGCHDCGHTQDWLWGLWFWNGAVIWSGKCKKRAECQPQVGWGLDMWQVWSAPLLQRYPGSWVRIEWLAHFNVQFIARNDYFEYWLNFLFIYIKIYFTISNWTQRPTGEVCSQSLKSSLCVCLLVSKVFFGLL